MKIFRGFGVIIIFNCEGFNIFGLRFKLGLKSLKKK